MSDFSLETSASQINHDINPMNPIERNPSSLNSLDEQFLQNNLNIEDIIKDITILKAKIILLEVQDNRIARIEKELKEKDDYIKNLELKLTKLYAISEDFNERVIKLEDRMRGNPDIKEDNHDKFLTESFAETSSYDNMSLQLDGECILIMYHDNTYKNEIEKELHREKKTCSLNETDKENIYKIEDIEWFMENLNIIISKPCIVNLLDIKNLTFRKNLLISNHVEFKSNTEVALYFRDKFITITNGARVKMEDFHISRCRNDKEHLFFIKNGSSLDFKGNVSDVHVTKAIFRVRKRCTLNLKSSKFENNVMEENEKALCITSEDSSEININECSFINHQSDEYPYSSRIIRSRGSLNIYSSEFKRNRCKNGSNYFSIIATGSANVTILGNTFSECCPISIGNSAKLEIKSCHFENFTINNYVGCLEIKECSYVNLEHSVFLNNKCNNGNAGCVFFDRNSKDINIKYCQFKDNEVIGDYIGNGGAIRLESSQCDMTNTTFFGNKSTSGGAIYSKQSNLKCHDCHFEKNEAVDAGGAIYCLKGKIDFLEDENEFKDNTAKISENVFYRK